MKNIILLILILPVILAAENSRYSRDLKIYQDLELIYDFSEFTSRFYKNGEGFISSFNTNTDAETSFGVLQQLTLFSRTAFKWGRFTFPVDISVGTLKRRLYNELETTTKPSEFIKNAVVVFQPGFIYSFLGFHLGFKYNLKGESRPVNENQNYWNYFHENEGKGSLTFLILSDFQIGRLPVHLLNNVRINPPSGLKFNYDTIFSLETGIRFNFTYYSSVKFIYELDTRNLAINRNNMSIRTLGSTRNIFKFHFDHRFSKSFGMSSSYMGVFYSTDGPPASRFSFSADYLWQPGKKENK